MSYRRKKNRKDAWDDYCNKNEKALMDMELDHVIYKTELNFRQWATHGYIENVDCILVSDLSDQQFEMLHRFITVFFDLDATLFDAYEESSRVRWHQG